MRVLEKSDSSVTEGSLARALTRLAAPMLVGGILQNVQSLIDLFWVGGLGPEAVAAVAMSGTILMVLFPMLMGLSTGTLALVARSVGAGRMDEAGRATSQSLILAAVLGVVSGLLGWFLSESLLRLLRAEPEVARQGGIYLRLTMAGGFTVFILFIANAALQGAGDAVTPMWIMAVANIVNIVLAPVFIFGIGPVPALGIAGAAIAMVAAQAIAAAISLCVLFSGRTRLHLKWDQWKPDAAMMWRILKIGIPGSGQMLSRSLVNAVVMLIVAGCGTAAVAGYGTGMRFHMIILMPAFALGGAAATMVGQNLGAGNPRRARHAAWLATWIDVVIMAVSAAIMLIFAAPLIRLFTRNADAEIVAVGVRYLTIVSPFYVFVAFGIVLGRALNGAGDSMSPMVITVLTLWGLQVPLAVFLSRVWSPATHGIWWAMASAFVVQGLWMIARFESGKWMKTTV